jgi:hypothetical protein
MSGGEFELALAVLDVSVRVGMVIKSFIERYRAALSDIDAIEASVLLTNCKTEQFYSALRGKRIPSRYYVPITRAIEILNPKLDALASLLRHYDHSDGELRPTDRAHWAAFGERRAKRIKVEIEDWSKNVFELVVVTLLTGIQEPLGGTGNLSLSDIVEFIKEVPGMEVALSMKEAVAATESPDQPTNNYDESLEVMKPVIKSIEEDEDDDETCIAIIKPNSRVILEHIYVPLKDGAAVYDPPLHKDTINLAAILHGSDPAVTYIPRCNGYFIDPEEKRYSLMYSDNVRSGGTQYRVTPHSLKSGIKLLYNPNPKSLTSHETAIVEALQDIESRTKMAIQLIHSLSYIHAIGWVHKGFQSRKILLAVADTTRNVLPLVLGFHRSRPSNTDITAGHEEYLEWEQVICRHPDRWKKQENPQFRKRYDVYALGVVLLELGSGKLAHEIAIERPSAKKSRGSGVELLSNEVDNVVETFIKNSKDLKKKQGKSYSENLERCFRQTSWRSGTEGMAADEEAEKEKDFCRGLLSKWVNDLSAMRF